MSYRTAPHNRLICPRVAIMSRLRCSVLEGVIFTLSNKISGSIRLHFGSTQVLLAPCNRTRSLIFFQECFGKLTILPRYLLWGRAFAGEQIIVLPSGASKGTETDTAPKSGSCPEKVLEVQSGGKDGFCMGAEEERCRKQFTKEAAFETAL